VAVHLLLPFTMSLTKDAACVYRAGFNQPSDPLPTAMRAALMFETMPATTGAEAEVPDMPPNLLSMMVRKLRPAMDMSG
jgi:hypothetical protein